MGLLGGRGMDQRACCSALPGLVISTRIGGFIEDPCREALSHLLDPLFFCTARLSLLEGRVGSQLRQIEDACMPASPRSAPVSPLKSGPWTGGPFASVPSPPHHSPSHRAESRAAQAAAVAAALVYGREGAYKSPSESAGGRQHSSEEMEAAHLGWAAYASSEAAMPGSPRIQAGGLARPASAAAACFGGGAGPVVGMRSGGKRSGPASKRSRAVELQVAETHAIIAGIQHQSETQG